MNSKQGRQALYSIEHVRYLRRIRVRRRIIVLLQIMLLISAFAIWEAAADYGWINQFITSKPSRAWTAVVNLFNRGELWRHLGYTIGETCLGFSVGTMAGIIVAAMLWWSDFISKILDPYIVILNSVPKVALGPIFIVWLGTGLKAVVAMAIATSVIVTIMVVHNGFKNIDPNKIKLMHTFGATRLQIFTKVVIPASIPTMIAALKVSVGLSLVGTIVGEFLGSKAGLGYLIVYGGQIFNMSLVMAAVIMLSIVSALLYYIVVLLERKVVKYNH
ncbi:MAG: ABC transporter permease [Firmicutes bacterium]|jgi:NitT/TauT family transport system permease protein|nr:ABC transporter permease [Bacillota bacterium]